MKINNYLNMLQEWDEPEIQEGDHMRCEICGREATITKAGQGPLICCGQPMTDLSQLEESGFKKYPKGWNKKSVKKWANTLTKEEVNAAAKKGFFDKCVKKMKKHMKNPEGFCASAKDEATGSTYWRGGGKTPQQAGKDIKAHQNVS